MPGASALAERLLADELPRRWVHVQGVGIKAVDLGPLVGASKAQLLVDAQVLHDVGYSSQIKDTGFHPIDGARHLRRSGFDERIVNLVAHHTCPRIEAELRGLGQILDDEFPKDESLPHAELCFCDITVSPVELTSVIAMAPAIWSMSSSTRPSQRFAAWLPTLKADARANPSGASRETERSGRFVSASLDASLAC